MKTFRKRGFYTPVAALYAAGGGAPVFPTLSNLVAHYTAEAANVTQASTVVSAVADLSGNGYTLHSFAGPTAGTGTVNWNATAFNGSFPGLIFTAANQTALATGGTIPTGVATLPSTASLSVFVVCDITSSSQSGGRVAVLAGANSPDYNVAGNIIGLARDGATSALQSYYNNAAPALSSSLTLDVPERIGLIASGGTFTQYINGVAQTGTGTASGTLALLSPTNIGIGTPWNAGGGWQQLAAAGILDGVVAEVVVTASDITANVSALDTYFKAKWGL